MFTDEEIAYLRSQPLARIATVSDDGQPDVAPVGFEFDGEHLYIGGIDVTKTRKYRNIRAGNDKVAVVVDEPSGPVNICGSRRPSPGVGTSAGIPSPTVTRPVPLRFGARGTRSRASCPHWSLLREPC